MDGSATTESGLGSCEPLGAHTEAALKELGELRRAGESVGWDVVATAIVRGRAAGLSDSRIGGLIWLYPGSFNRGKLAVAIRKALGK